MAKGFSQSNSSTPEKQWRVFAHPGYFASFRQMVVNPDERFKVTVEIRKRLAAIHNLDLDATPVIGEPELYEIRVLQYTLIIRWRKAQPDDIILLEIYE